MRRKFNKELKNYLLEFAKDKTVDELLPLVNDTFNEMYTKGELRKYLYRNEIPYKYAMPSRVVDMSTLPIGTERVRDDGMVMVKVTRNKWMYKQRYIYEQHYNVKLTGNDFIVFQDGDRTNFDISNLKRVSKYVASHLRNASHNKETRPLELLTYELKVKIKDWKKEYEKRNN